MHDYLHESGRGNACAPGRWRASAVSDWKEAPPRVCSRSLSPFRTLDSARDEIERLSNLLYVAADKVRAAAGALAGA